MLRAPLPIWGGVLSALFKLSVFLLFRPFLHPATTKLRAALFGAASLVYDSNKIIFSFYAGLSSSQPQPSSMHPSPFGAASLVPERGIGPKAEEGNMIAVSKICILTPLRIEG